MIQIRSLPDGDLLQHFNAGAGGMLYLALSRDGTLLASTAIDNNVNLWSVPDGEHVKTLRASQQVDGYQMPWTLLISPDGSRLAYHYRVESQSFFKLWSLPEGKIILSQGISDSAAFVFSPDSALLAVQDYFEGLKILEYGNRRTVGRIWYRNRKWVNHRTLTGWIAAGNRKQFRRHRTPILARWRVNPNNGRSVWRFRPCDSLYLYSGQPPTAGWILRGRDATLVRSQRRSCRLSRKPTTIQSDVEFQLAQLSSGELTAVECGAGLPDGAICTCNCVTGSGCTCVGNVGSGPILQVGTTGIRIRSERAGQQTRPGSSLAGWY